MLDNAIKVLEMIENNGYEVYIVGGFVRDYLLDNSSNDIDITTNAIPKDLIKIFPNAEFPKNDLGAVTLYFNDVRFEITTYRVESEYINNRRPSSISYTNSVDEDITRRDFTINGLLMDKNKKIIDLVGGKKDLEDHIIRCIGDSNKKFSDDALRMLRAIRFAAKLNFIIDKDTVDAIKKNKFLLKNISYDRKKDELNKIFMCHNAKYGIKLILDLGLDSILELPNLKMVTYTDNLCAIWAIIDSKLYPFSKGEREQVNKIKACLKLDNFDNYVLYEYGPYYNTIAVNMKGGDSRNISLRYNNLPIHSFKDVDISISYLLKLLNKESGDWINDMKTDIEKNILYNKLDNNKDDIVKYILEKY